MRAQLVSAALGYLAATAVHRRKADPKPASNPASNTSTPTNGVDLQQAAATPGTHEEEKQDPTVATAVATAMKVYRVVVAGLCLYAVFVVTVLTIPSLWTAGPDVVIGGLFAVLLLAQAALYQRTSTHPWGLAFVSVAVPTFLFSFLLWLEGGLTTAAVVGGVVALISAVGVAWLEAQSD